MKLCAIRSGSSGNAILVWTDKTKILIDCGISGKTAEAGILDVGVDPKELQAILITHEHTDHIRGAGVLARRYKLPIFANEKTWQAMETAIGRLAPEFHRTFSHTDDFSIGDLAIYPFSIPHDAADPVGYSICNGNKKISVATDIGVLQESIFRAIGGSQAVLLESNHDLNLLDTGSYPLPLKQRIRSDRGHLSNEDAGYAAKFLVKMGARQILLGHLSPENNYPLLAKKTVSNILEDAGILPGRDMDLNIAPGDRISSICAV